MAHNHDGVLGSTPCLATNFRNKQVPMIIKTADDVDVEVSFCDAGYAPGSKPGQLLNTMAVWFKPAGGEWQRSKHRSAIVTARDIRHYNSSDLHLVSDHKSITEEKPNEKANSVGSTSDGVQQP